MVRQFAAAGGKSDGQTSPRHVRRGFRLRRFSAQFEDAVTAWNPGDWAETFARTGARYVVLVTKHHDGYLLWPSRTPNPRRAGFQSRRDLVGELGEAVRARGMRFGLYYSGGLDWVFEPGPVRDLGGLLGTIPSDPAYAQYAVAHWRELVERYLPDVLWNDIGFPAGVNLNELLAWYYARRPEGAANDRFSQTDLGRGEHAARQAAAWTDRQAPAAAAAPEQKRTFRARHQPRRFSHPGIRCAGGYARLQMGIDARGGLFVWL